MACGRAGIRRPASVADRRGVCAAEAHGGGYACCIDLYAHASHAVCADSGEVVHKDLRNKTADATRRYKTRQPMELQPGSWAEPRAVTWGLRILDGGRLVLEAPHDHGDYISVA